MSAPEDRGRGAARPVGQALAGRRLPLSRRLGRSVGYLAGTVVPTALAVPLGALGVPTVLLVGWLQNRSSGEVTAWLPAVAVTALATAALTVVVGPLVAVPLGRLERHRLRLVDARPALSGHRPLSGRGPLSWLRDRCGESATWLEVSYGLLLLTVVPAVLGTVFTLMLLVGTAIVGPVLLWSADGSVSLGVVTLTSAGPAIPFSLVGLALVPWTPRLLCALAAAQGSLARALLSKRPEHRWRTELVEVTRSRARLVDGFEAERRRIERDLHDGTQQRLVGLTLRLGIARLDLPPDSPAAAAVADAHEQAKQLMAELRELVRGIYPRVLTDLGLRAALRELAQRCSVPVALECALSGRPATQVESAAYFSVSEALTNVDRHSGATRAFVTVQRQGDTLRLEIRDDGTGGADPAAGSGLAGLADRIAAVDGRMWLSSPEGGPTVVRVELPWHYRPSSA
ncbi:sensor histidine kinase [Streptomyces sp. NPDC001443]